MHSLIAAALVVVSAVVFGAASSNAAELGDQWMSKIRRDHPRLFFNKDTWPLVKARALGPEKLRYEKVKWWAVDKHPDNPEVVRDWGPAAADTAFVYLMTGDRRCLEKSKKMLRLSIAHYQKRYEERRAVDWTSTTRVCTIAAYDWLYNDLTPAERREILPPLLQHVDDMQRGPDKPRIRGVNHSDHTTGFYGEENLLWFAGLAGFEDGIDDERAARFLRLGYQHNQDLLRFRKRCAGDDGGTASGTIMYALVHYLWSEFNFFHTWRSATGENLADKWPHLAYFPVWVMWNSPTTAS
jgi:hypothetical protein